ncbi:MAG: rhodanese-like domain-containing protein [Gammaproteobacteria bacterium]|nr:rhodanese-like domain-containing protein [Gammaproteobacteria bacterium]
MCQLSKRLLAISLILLTAFAVAGEEFPGRKLYPEVEIVTLEQLKGMPKETHIVDVRSPYEYATIHIKGAINVPIAHAEFVKKIRALRKKSFDPIIFYCNGHTCFKSYKAARKAQVFGVGDVFSFDAGIFDWARAQPGRTVLLGKSPIDPSQLISKKKHKTRQIGPEEFKRRAESDKYAVIDVRSRTQRASMGLFPFVEKWASLEDSEKLRSLLEQAQKEQKTLLIYDNVGKQVRWLEYRLRAMKIKDYYFMRGGAEAYQKLK